MMAVVAMINEGIGGKGAEGSVLERKFRRSVTKSMNLVKKRKRKRLPGKMRDVMKLIDEARSGRNMISWVKGVLALVCYLGIRRFSDVNRVRVGDVSFREDGAVE